MLHVDRTQRMTGGFYIWCILYSYEREITLNPEYWVCGGGRGWWLVVVVVVDISRYFPIETDWCPSQHFHHQTSPTPTETPRANLAMLDSGQLWVSILSSPVLADFLQITPRVKTLSCSDHWTVVWCPLSSLLCPAFRTTESPGGRVGWVPANILP